MAQMDGILGKKVIIFYDDVGHCSRKDGTITTNETDYLILDYTILIPKNRLVRIEVQKKGEENVNNTRTD